MVKFCRFLSTGEESPSLLAAATIALTLTATATDVSAQWRRRGWGWGPGVAAGVIGGAVIAGAIIASRPPGYVVYPGRVRTAGVRTRVLLGIPACLRRCRPRCRLYRPTGTGLPWLCCASAACFAPVKMIGEPAD